MAILKGHKMAPGEQPDVLSQLLHTLVLTCNWAIVINTKERSLLISLPVQHCWIALAFSYNAQQFLG